MNSETTHIKYFVIGEIPKNFIEEVLNVVKKFLEIVDRVYYFEIYFYSSTDHKLAFLEAEASELGVIAVGDFVAMHEAWRGWPRIHIDYEKSSSLPHNFLEAIIIHEVSHAVLHGSPIFYSVAIPFNNLRDLDYEELAKAIYIATTIVKDMDVHEFLQNLSMTKTIEDYAKFTAEQVENINCESIDEILQLAKILTPCIFIDKCIPVEKIPSICRDRVNNVLTILRKFKQTRFGDLSLDTMLLIKKLKSLI